MTETRVVVAGTDTHDIAGPIEDAGFALSVVDVGNRSALESVDIAEADIYVLTEAAQATSIPVAKDLNPELKVVVYTEESLSDFALPQTDLILDPALFDPEEVTAELDA
ncbi:hypothetical protein SAMN05216226_11178 [Halovenus aranensis]|uniref:CTP synthetase n=1 Tax=Halovenus aranensis TaxID=890420 RepID=A0A1G8XHC7_9EURY|nr:CTP synthetase [Halovenus aranensis]SDJ89921.1 hypothetical protein SAMN05216226_11178 [Halovenus aranensis]